MRPRQALTLLAAVAMLTACTSSSGGGSSPQQASETSTVLAPTRDPAPSVLTSLLAEAVAPPVPVPATDGKTHLAYELRLTNTLSHDVTLTSVTVLDRDVALLTLDGGRLSQWTRVLGTPTPTTTIGAAQTAVVWLDVALDKGTPVPAELTHDVALSNPEPQDPLFPATQTVNVARVAVQSRKPLVIDPPLSGPGWIDVDGCCMTSAHRSALNPINGQLWAAERFAIDYVQLDGIGRIMKGPPNDLASYKYFGAEIHAVGDGPVVSVLDGLPEQVPGKDPTGLRFEEYGGNHVVQDLGDGNYAFYAHIKTGTVAVKPGDRLTTGQVIANLGNTGNSSAPHLHFHVMNGPDPLRSDGLPFAYNGFRLSSRIPTVEDFGPIFDGHTAPAQPGFVARDETDVMPLELDVMDYGQR